ncbi:hypothetical protein NDU88_007638 [Pleurodeles waltl]|uniref:Uncharacterized protein n=1 Tax=Pleurodeles waltl TaxID=8319 RepID=A0AAV7N6G3_PLEWA|nr:hypothetical protein NDU88_007638 [Pleurodeles waltl]
MESQRRKPRQVDPILGTVSPEPKPAGEASLGPVYAKALQVTADWRKGAPTLGSGTPVCSVESQVWRRDPSDRAARRPHTWAPRAGRPRTLWCPVPEPLDAKRVRRSLSLLIRRKAILFLVLRAHRGTEGTTGENAPDLLEPWLGLRKQMSPHRDIWGSLAI